MEKVAPLGDVYQAGTLSGNPVAMAAGYAQLKECLKADFYQTLDERTQYLVNTLNEFLEVRDYPVRLFHIGSIFWISFSREKHVDRADTIDSAGMDYFKNFHHDLLSKGVYLGPSGYEVGFISMAHTMEVVRETAEKMQSAFDNVFRS